MSDLQREESFRSAIKNQKRRLSATKAEKKNSLCSDTGFAKPAARIVPLALKNRDSMTPPRREGTTPPTSNRSTPVRINGPDNNGSLTAHDSNPDIRLEFWDISELSPLSTPATSPKHSPRSSPSPHNLRSQSRSPSPHPFSSPVPLGSPLFSTLPMSPALKRARSFTKELMRARSFRALREKSCSRNSSAVNSRCASPEPEIASINKMSLPQEVSFCIKRALGSRKGWKIMPEDGQPMNGDALRKVVNMIKDIEFQGFAVPERITIKLV